MPTELKQAIVNHIFDNKQVFGLHNFTTHTFHDYIYDREGEYLIGGKVVSEFIDKAIKLIGENNA
jgi:hypothetical protein